ncbi:hypothetical protein QQZ08_001382 [Neonectria magnoliae]|uniref:Uncharacterized protein n=1 Tax=Neonectria magnoliae TaxID=2732573 RepID=A0ABR1IH19_9HYPO
MYNDQYDLYKDFNTIKGKMCVGIFLENYTERNPQVLGLTEKYDQDQASYWILSSALYNLAARTLNWGSNLAHLVVRRIFQIMHIRRTMRSQVALPDGTKMYPADGLLPATIMVEEVSFDETLPDHASISASRNTTEVQRPNHHAPEYRDGEPVAIRATVVDKPGPLAPTHPPVTGEGECNTNEIAAAKASNYIWDRLNRNLVDEA